MNNKNLISRSIIISSILVTVLLVLLTSYIGYRLPFVQNLQSLISQVRLYNQEGHLISTIVGTQFDKNNLIGAARAEIDLDFSKQNFAKEDLSIYITPIQNPILILQNGKIIQEIGDFSGGKSLKEQDSSIALKNFDLTKVAVLNIKKNVIKGTELDFIFNSGISENNRIATMKLARSILVVYGYLAMSALFFSFFILITVIWLNSNPYKNFGALALSFLGQSWIAFYFSRVWMQTGFVTEINLISFVIYFFSMGFLLLSFLGKENDNLKVLQPIQAESWPVIMYFVSGIIMTGCIFFLDISKIMSVYKALLTISLFGLSFFLVVFLKRMGSSKAQDRFTLLLALSIILFGQFNDIMRVHSKILFMYNIGPYAFFLGSLILIANAINILQQRFLLSLENEKYYAIYSVAQQVSHDIRSPISALNMIVGQLQNIPEQHRLLIRHSVNRINDIANSLLEKGKQKSMVVDANSSVSLKLQLEMLGSLIDILVSEKRTQFRNKPNIEIEAKLQNSYGAFIKVNNIELKRVLSNLITNAVEALDDQKGLIQISVIQNNAKNIIRIEDNGKGIPDAVLVKLGERGVTHGKSGNDSGSGLGIYHAKNTVESFGGQFIIESKVGVGTVITMTFPAEAPPDWFVSSLKLTTDTSVVICDDDSSIHGLWTERLKSLSAPIQDLHFSSDEAFLGWYQNRDENKRYLFLMDFELLGCKKNGLDLIENLKLNSEAFLVTSRYEEKNILERCKSMGVKLIPKGMSEYIPIINEPPKVKPDAILIDDDPLMKLTWEFSAKENGASIRVFDSQSAFLEGSKDIDLTTPIYVDVNLGHGIKGTDVALKLSEIGFKMLYLTTGYEAASLGNIPSCILEVRGKDPVFSYLNSSTNSRPSRL
ncbi:MAG: sensor histidine kinase [Pseudobdellovibrionaceae bacterium]